MMPGGKGRVEGMGEEGQGAIGNGQWPGEDQQGKKASYELTEASGWGVNGARPRNGA